MKTENLFFPYSYRSTAAVLNCVQQPTDLPLPFAHKLCPNSPFVACCSLSLLFNHSTTPTFLPPTPPARPTKPSSTRSWPPLLPSIMNIPPTLRPDLLNMYTFLAMTRLTTYWMHMVSADQSDIRQPTTDTGGQSNREERIGEYQPYQDRGLKHFPTRPQGSLQPAPPPPDCYCS